MSYNVRKTVTTAILIALGMTLPFAFHSIPNSGSIILPMHIPVLICGLICGWPYGLACGILTPLLSSFVTGMPPMFILPSMLFELAVYGASAGILFQLIKTKNFIANLYLSLLGAMVLGRITYGILNSLIFSAGEYSLNIWMTASFVTALPGIVIQLVFIPVIVLTLKKAKLIYV